MKYMLTILLLCLFVVAGAQNNPQSKEEIRQQMAKIRQTTDWNDPAAAKKANEEIQRLAKQLSGGQQVPVNTSVKTQQQTSTNTTVEIAGKESEASQEKVLAIAERFFQRSYRVLDAISKSQFDQDLKKAESEKFNLKSVRRLSSSGAALITFSDNPDLACVYLTSAVKALPTDTTCVNNFGAFLRMIDSVKTSLQVLIYANKLFSGSPIILTQIGNSYYELGDYAKAETYFKDALKYNPSFGQAHSSLCELYIWQNRLDEAIQELFAGVMNNGCSYTVASNNYKYLQKQSENTSSPEGQNAQETFWNLTKKQIGPEATLASTASDDSESEESNDDVLAPLVPDENTGEQANSDDALAPLVPEENADNSQTSDDALASLVPEENTGEKSNSDDALAPLVPDEQSSNQGSSGSNSNYSNSEDALAPLVPDDSRVKMPNFPTSQKVEDWLEGGGWGAAVVSYQSFQNYMLSFNKNFKMAHDQTPTLGPNATLRSFADSRLALDCITEYFYKKAREDEKEYQQKVDVILDGINAAKEAYISNTIKFAEQHKECYEGCAMDPYCIEECHRKYCKDECPNANKFNEYLRRAYSDWSMEFNKYVNTQTKNLDDLYEFSIPWLNKIKGPYWNLIYAYEIKRVALTIAGSCYAQYMQPIGTLSHNDCGTDCSVHANPYPFRTGEINKKEPDKNNCPPDSKDEVAIVFVTIAWDCESWEIGSAVGGAWEVKRNTAKGTTSLFLGAGLEGGLGAKAGGKFGGEIILGDDGSIDGGLKGEFSGGTDVPLSKGGPTGYEVEYHLTIMGGLKTETTKVYNPFFKK